jgi:hypothetical protein
VGVGVRHALFPGGTRLDALAIAGGVLPDATLRGTRMSRSHGGTVPAVAGRDLSSEASAPGRTLPAGSGAPDVVLTRLQLSSSRRHLLSWGRHRLVADRWPRVTGLTSYLSGCISLLQRGDVVFHAAPVEEVDGLCLGPLTPRGCDSLARPARAASWAFWRGRPARNRNCVLVCAVATKTLWGNCVGARVETSREPDSAQRGFSSRLAAQFLVRVWTDRTRLRPEELVIYASHLASAIGRGGRHQLSPAFPRSPGIILSRALSGAFKAAALRLFYQGTSRNMYVPSRV